MLRSAYDYLNSPTCKNATNAKQNEVYIVIPEKKFMSNKKKCAKRFAK